jgi:hypothetical protein
MGLKNWLKVVLNKLFGVSRKRLAEPGQLGFPQYSTWARFIFQSGHYRKSNPAAPKPNAFLPDPQKLKTSAIWRDELSEAEIWDIGDILGNKRNQKPEARADLEIATLAEAKLTIEPEVIS